MPYCLDTNTCVDALRGARPGLVARFASLTPEDIQIPSMVRAELLHGALRSADPAQARRAVQRFLSPYEVVAFDGEAADHYADIRCGLESRGMPIGPNDLVIAATARSRGLVLVTHNTDEFSRVPGLRLEDWAV
jgi:tRNA(fMet)-specific endonuclease VapC